jgi:putative phosphoribosyl transferase
MTFDRDIHIETANGRILGDLCIPFHFPAIVLFAHATGSSRNSPRNQFLAQHLNQAVLSTLMLDLLTSQEETIDELNGHKRFDIDLLANRVAQAIEWIGIDASTCEMLDRFAWCQHWKRGRDCGCCKKLFRKSNCF